VPRPGRLTAHQRRVTARLEALLAHDAARVPRPLPPGLLLGD
jgi:hypothetical protein